jgi:tetratricopeptide (TPR) repeat protein
LIYIFFAGLIGLPLVLYFASPQGMGGGNGSHAAREERMSEVVGTVDGTNVTRGEYLSLFDRLKSQQQATSSIAEVSVAGRALSMTVDNAIEQAEFKRLGLKVTDADKEKALAPLRKMMGETKKLSDDEFAKLLGAPSMSELREMMDESLVPVVLARKMGNTDAISEDDLKKSYDEIKVSHILIGVDTSPRPSSPAYPDAVAKNKAEKIHAEAIKPGADFAKLANENTTDPTNKPTKFDPKLKKMVPDGAPKGGDMGWYRRGGGFVKPFEDAAFALKPNEISNVVKTDFGYHIIKVNGTRNQLPKDYDKQKTELLESYRQSKGQTALAEFVAEKRKTAKVVWKDPQLDWQYAYSQLNSAGGAVAFKEAQDAFVAKLEKYTAEHKDDTNANLILGQLIHQKYIMSAIDKGGKPAADSPERIKLRDQAISYFQAAVSRGGDENTQFTLARLYQEAKQNDKALDIYKDIEAQLNFDPEDTSKRFSWQNLAVAYKQLNNSELATKAEAKFKELEEKQKLADEKAEKERKEQEAAAAKAKAELDKKAKEDAAKAKAGTPGTPPAPGASGTSAPGATAPPAGGAPPAGAASPAKPDAGAGKPAPSGGGGR